jgi:hypothetical protein
VRARLNDFARWIGAMNGARAEFIANIERRTGRKVDEIDSVGLAPKREQRLLILHDPADREVPFADAEHLEKLWRGSELVRLSNLGHRRLLRDAAVIDRVVRFIAPAVAAPAPRWDFAALHWH